MNNELKIILEMFFTWCDMLKIPDDAVEMRYYKKLYKSLQMEDTTDILVTADIADDIYDKYYGERKLSKNTKF